MDFFFFKSPRVVPSWEKKPVILIGLQIFWLMELGGIWEGACPVPPKKNIGENPEKINMFSPIAK